MRGEAGTTLVEVVVAVALIALAAAFGCGALAGRPAAATTTARTFAGLIDEARALAAANAGAGDGGATIGVVRAGNVDVATLYVYRPIRGAAHVPIPAPNVPPLRTLTRLGIVAGGQVQAPPFALFVSPSGNASALAPFTVGDDAPPAAEPACGEPEGIDIAFIDGVADRAHPLTCKVARLELDIRLPVPIP